MKQTILALSVTLALAASATQYSKLSVITASKMIGCWDALKAFIIRADLKDEWDCCQYLSDYYPQFASATNALVSSGVVSAENLVFILTNSVDTAVADALLRRVYDNDMTSSSGRARWHGKIVRQVVDTNTLQKVTYYEDGTAFTDKARITTATDSVRSYNATLQRPVITNGVPSRLAEARLRRNEEKAITNSVLRTIRAGE